MTTLVPSLGSCELRMTNGERCLAERLEQQLDEDYLLWYDVPVGLKQTDPDFVVLNPRRSLLIPETKDCRLDTIQSGTPPLRRRAMPTKAAARSCPSLHQRIDTRTLDLHPTARGPVSTHRVRACLAAGRSLTA
ncbi:NERD domain-containing protein [Pseudorhodoferax soli]|uniref:Nuclease-like protein n=1 Tax=Pseudorhodoferax soli TaxID=545864 RepID=A0A368XV50_9BURK|nr:nuclease-like protein [Pseudorhodoferax soli]